MSTFSNILDTNCFTKKTAKKRFSKLKEDLKKVKSSGKIMVLPTNQETRAKCRKRNMPNL